MSGILPHFEYIERTLRGDVNKYERDILVKKYNRSSAGKSKAFPEDVRPISVLTSVLDYLLQFCDFSLESYKFLENRTRSIRLDISIQELECDRTIMILEKICRLLILYNYALYDNKEFEEYLNIEQIKKILGTLKELYNNKNKQGLSNNTHRSKNYQEFMGYYKLITFDDVLNTSDLSLTSKLSLFDNIKMAYTQNNLYRFFLLSRSTDFLSFCLLHTYYDKLRLKGIEIYSKCFIEKIDSSLINKLLFLSERELISLCNKTNIQLTQTSTTTSKEDVSTRHTRDNIRDIRDTNGILVDFKNKDLFDNEDILVKDRKISLMSPKMIHFGDLDYHIKRVLIGLWVEKTFISKKYTLAPVISRKKTKINIFTSREETEKDIFRIILKIYCKISTGVFSRDIKKRVNIFEKKKKIAKEMCHFILVSYIHHRINIICKKDNISSTTCNNNDNLAVVTDDSIFSAIFLNTLKKSNIMKYNPLLLQYKDISLNTLIKYRVSVFALNKKYHKDTEMKYNMLNKLIDTPQNCSKRIQEINNLIEKSKKIIRNKLNNLLENKSRIKQISILTHLIENGRNKDIRNEWIEKIDKKQRLENIEVYYEDGEMTY